VIVTDEMHHEIERLLGGDLDDFIAELRGSDPPACTYWPMGLYCDVVTELCMCVSASAVMADSTYPIGERNGPVLADGVAPPRAAPL